MTLTPTCRDHRSVSSMCVFSRCPRLYFWTRQLSLERESSQRTVAMDFGSAIHAAVPYTFLPGGGLVEAKSAFARVWGERDDLSDPKRNSEVAHHIIVELGRVHEKGTRLYTPVVPELKSNVARGELSPHEIEFNADFGLPSKKLVNGRIDALGVHETTTAMWGVEYKTTSQLWGNFGDLFQLSPQVITYFMALKVCGYEPAGVFVEAIKVAAIDKRGGCGCAVLPIPVEVSEVKEQLCLGWWLRHDAQLQELEDIAPSDPLAWPAQCSRCNPYSEYGLQGYECEFEPLCVAGQDWERLAGLFVVKEREKETGDE